MFVVEQLQKTSASLKKKTSTTRAQVWQLPQRSPSTAAP